MKDNIPELLVAITVIFLLGSVLLSVYSSDNRQACVLHAIAAGYTASDITVICK